MIREGPVAGVPPELTPGGRAVRVTTEEIVLAWPGVGAIAVRRGVEIVVDRAAGAPEGLLGPFLLGPGLGVLLHQRGRLVLHASALTTDAGAVVFLGTPGEGKSTTAAALLARGGRLVTDDVLAVQADPTGPPLAFPSFPQLRLWPEAVAALGGPPDLPRIVPGVEKRVRRVGDRFDGKPVPVARVYLLAEGSTLAIEPLDAQGRFAALAHHSYCGRLVPQLGPADHLRRCARLATSVPVRRLRRPRELARLAELARLVESDTA